MKNNLTINLVLPIKIVLTADNDGVVITDATNTEYFFYNQKDSDFMEYDGFSMTLSEDKEVASGIAKKLREHIESLSEEEVKEIRKKYFTDDRPKGWVDIEHHLPMMLAMDIVQGYSVFKVRDVNGNEFETKVSDHNTWYHMAKEIGITHWFNK